METTLSRTDQKRTFEKTWDADGDRFKLKVKVRYGDGCGNGKNTFAITGELYRRVGGAGGGPGPVEFEAGGCIHEEIAARFPKMAPHLKYHLCSTDGPMHYPKNPLFLAGNKDCWGRRKGEPSAYEYGIFFGQNPIFNTFGWMGESFVEFLKKYGPACKYDFEILPYDHDDRKTFGTKYTFGGYAERWYECPFDTEREAERFLDALKNCKPHFGKVATRHSDGKEPELEGARSSAIWPDGTLAQLQDEKVLRDRLPALLADFRQVVESYGFVY